MSHTYAILDVPGTVYGAVRTLLTAANYDHAIHDHREGEVIDMHGIALRARPGHLESNDVVITTLLSARTHEGRVEIAMNGQLTQLDLPKAREIVGMLQQAIEAATSDQILWRFLTDRIGLSDEKAAAAMFDFREIRQGSRGTVHPS